MAEDLLTFDYKFTFSDKTKKEFSIKLDNQTLDLITTKKESYPDWAKLECSKCSNCPLDKAQYQYCPIARNLTDLINFFKEAISFHDVSMLIETKGRTYLKDTSLQKALSSLIGIYMVTSGCPIMDKLRPMVRHHLPFASIEETQYRAISMYLLAQYFLYKKGKQPDWDLNNLVKIYDDVRIVNKSFCQRLLDINVKDASMNAVVILDCCADAVTFSINKDMLNKVELLFKAYL